MDSHSTGCCKIGLEGTSSAVIKMLSVPMWFGKTRPSVKPLCRCGFLLSYEPEGGGGEGD